MSVQIGPHTKKLRWHERLMGAHLVLPKMRLELDPSLWATTLQNFTTRVCTFLESLSTQISRGGVLVTALTPTSTKVSKQNITLWGM